MRTIFQVVSPYNGATVGTFETREAANGFRNELNATECAELKRADVDAREFAAKYRHPAAFLPFAYWTHCVQVPNRPKG